MVVHGQEESGVPNVLHCTGWSSGRASCSWSVRAAAVVHPEVVHHLPGVLASWGLVKEHVPHLVHVLICEAVQQVHIVADCIHTVHECVEGVM